MKKSTSRFALRSETLRVLEPGSLAAVVGGNLDNQIIIRPRPTISCPQPSSPSHNSECVVDG
jgi:hypothetical protein